MKRLLIVSGIFLAIFVTIRGLGPQIGLGPSSVSKIATPETQNSSPNSGQNPANPNLNEGQGQPSKPFILPPDIPKEDTIFLLNGRQIAQGANLNASGQGFTPHEEVQFYLSGTSLAKPQQLDGVEADEHGNFGASLPLPKDLKPGVYTVKVVGSKSQKSGNLDFELEAGLPWVDPNIWSGKPLYPVSFSGHGFQPGEAVDVFFDSLAGTPILTTTADKAGEFVTNASIPITPEGSHSYFFLGQKSKLPIKVPFSVLAFTPWATLSTYTPNQEDPLGFSVQDFAPGEAVRVYLNKIAGQPLVVFNVDDTGNSSLENAFSVPLGTAGTNTLYFIGESSYQVITTEFQVMPFTPGVELTEYAGVPGTEVSLKGSGFAKNELVHVYFGRAQDKKEVSNFQTDENGAFEDAGTFSVPFKLYYGSQPVTAEGEKSKTSLELTFEVLKFSPWFALDPYSGPPGGSLQFLGGGFAKNEPVTIHQGDASSLIVARGTTDEEGNFYEVGPYSIPKELRGKITFTIWGENSGAETNATFEVIEELAEPTPSPSP